MMMFLRLNYLFFSYFNDGKKHILLHWGLEFYFRDLISDKNKRLIENWFWNCKIRFLNFDVGIDDIKRHQKNAKKI